MSPVLSQERAESRIGIETVMISVFGDESHDERCERVFTVGILLGFPEAWHIVESRWRTRNSGVPFHANNCDSDKGDFASKPGEDQDQKHSANKALYKENTILLAESGLLGFASNVDLQAQAKYMPSLVIDSPRTYYKCFWDVIEMIQAVAGQFNDVAECVFDSRTESEFNAGFLYGQLRENYPQWAPRLAEKIIFDSSKKNPRLQMADLWAREAMKALDNDIGPVKRRRRSWQTLSATKRFTAYSYSHDWFRDFSVDYENVKQRLGYSDEECMKWLREKRLQPNFANLVRFLRPIMKEHSKTLNKREPLNDT
jgi:hypothetical protein